jgi:RNA ligase (TIGR02306 family)
VWQNDLEEGQEVTELLGVTLYTPLIPACLTGVVKGLFSSWMMKTDETRVQVLQDVLTRHKGTKCYITEKVDGSSCTYYMKDGIFGVCSRNLELLEDTKNAFWIFAREQKIEEKLKALNKNIAIQGELIGSGINGNSLKLREKKVLFFNVFDIDKFGYYNFEEFKNCINDLGLETVPILNIDYELNDNIEELVKLAIGKSVINTEVWREGIVIRPWVEKNDLQLAQGFGNGRLTFKVINTEYLIEVEQ